DNGAASVRSKPEIYPLYWSPAQIQARQHDRMARVQAFLNHQWKHESDGVRWFDPARNLLYPDRIRRRPPGTDSAGLGTHLDPGTLDLWLTQGYQKVFRHLFDGTVEQYDPWDAASAPPHRSTPAPRCAQPSAPSGAGPPCPTCPTTRVSCTRSPSPARWLTSCCAHCSPTSPATTCAASPSARRSPPATSGTTCCCG